MCTLMATTVNVEERREDRKREDAAGRTTIRVVARSQSMARGFARAIESVEERLRNVS